jgi:PKD repeat protein
MKRFLTVAFLVVCSCAGATDYAVTTPLDFSQTLSNRIENGTFIWRSGTMCSTNTRALSIIQQAFNEWMVEGTVIKFSYGGAETVPPSPYTSNIADTSNLQNHVYWGTLPDTIIGKNQRWLDSNSQLVECDIIFNISSTWSDNMIKHVALHEIGHILGFPDYTDTEYANAIMYYANLETSPTSLSDLEKNAVKKAYPAFGVTASGSPLSGPTPLATSFSSASVGGTPVSYLWNFGDGTTDSNAAPPHTFNSLGVYNVTLTVKDAIGNTATSTLAVYVTGGSLGSGYGNVINNAPSSNQGALLKKVAFSYNAKKQTAKLTMTVSNDIFFNHTPTSLTIGDTCITWDKYNTVKASKYGNPMRVTLNSTALYGALNRLGAFAKRKMIVPVMTVLTTEAGNVYTTANLKIK